VQALAIFVSRLSSTQMDAQVEVLHLISCLMIAYLNAGRRLT
jgi:hypothetical protein